MPYTMSLYPDERKRYPAPKVGDKFVVVKVDEGVMDMHWGRCVHIELRASQRTIVALPPEISKAEFEEAKETLRKIFAGGLTWASWPPLTAEQEADCLIDVEAYIRDSVCKQHCNMEGLDGDTTVCGHPRSSAVSADEGTSHCGECERRALETLDLTRLV